MIGIRSALLNAPTAGPPRSAGRGGHRGRLRSRRPRRPRPTSSSRRCSRPSSRESSVQLRLSAAAADAAPPATPALGRPVRRRPAGCARPPTPRLRRAARTSAVPAERLGDGPHDGQAQPGPAARTGRVAPVEAVEDAGGLFGRDPRSVVGHPMHAHGRTRPGWTPATVVPGGVWASALRTRLCATWVRRSASPITTTGPPGHQGAAVARGPRRPSRRPRRRRSDGGRPARARSGRPRSSSARRRRSSTRPPMRAASSSIRLSALLRPGLVGEAAPAQQLGVAPDGGRAGSAARARRRPRTGAAAPPRPTSRRRPTRSGSASC